MTDETPDPDYIERLKARDNRFAYLAEAIAVETDLRDNTTIRALMDAVRRDADLAMREFVQVSPADLQQVADYQVRIRTFTYIRDVLDAIMRRGAQAEQEIRQEDMDG
jgi:hypothetical protein